MTMAFQPIVDVADARLFGCKALVRGCSGESAGELLAELTDENRYAFDQTCRVAAIELARAQGVGSMLSINFLTNGVYRPETCIRATLEAARAKGFPRELLMSEVTESKEVRDRQHLENISTEYERQGLTTAIDDVGAGHSGLNLLADFQPAFVKLDTALTRDVDRDQVRRAIVSGIVRLGEGLSIRIIAEGIETTGECPARQDEGIMPFQGYLFARPGFESLPSIPAEVWDSIKPRRASNRRRQCG